MGLEGESGRDGQLNQLYLAIISRYKDYIEEKEELSVAELPTLVTPKADAVIRKANAIKADFSTYNYDKDFIDAALKAFEFVKGEVDEIALPIQFWLTPDETMRFKVGDRIDRNILLCSILISLGNPSSKVFVLKTEEMRRIYVYFEFGPKTLLMDIDSGIREFPDAKAMVSSFSIKEDDTAYEFNNQSYADVY